MFASAAVPPSLSEGDGDEVVVEFPDLAPNHYVSNWTEYDANTHFLTPTDGWNLSIGDAPNVVADLVRHVAEGTRVRLYVNGHAQLTGRAEIIDTSGSRTSGGTMRIEGRDVFAPLVDGNVDPRRQWQATDTLAKIVFDVLEDYGFDRSQVVMDNDANREILTGGLRGVPRTTKGKPLKKFTAFRCKPYPGEGAYAFLYRCCSRFGLYLWPSADGETVICGRPNFAQTPTHTVRMLFDGPHDVLQTHCRRDYAAQPSAIVATGHGDADLQNRQNVARYIVNELTAYDGASKTLRQDVQKALSRLPSALQVHKANEIATTARMQGGAARVLYLHDNESATADQLAFFLRRELAERQRKSLSYTLVARNHTQNGNPWAIDTMIDVQDQYNAVTEHLWCLSRTFSKSRQAGTLTHAELIRQGTMEFGDGS